MQLTGCGRHEGLIFLEYNLILRGYLNSTGNTMVIIYENKHRVIREIVKRLQTVLPIASLICTHGHNMHIQATVEKVEQ